jgi:RND family efflux transporter MFP subunit
MPGKLRLKHFIIIVPILALGAFIGYRVFQAVKAKSAMQQAPPGQGGGGRGGPGGGGRAQVVQTGAVSSGKISEKITLTGSLKAKEQVDVNPKIQGRIVRILVDTGQAVSRGALIAEVEDDEIKQQVERSKAAIAVVDASIAQREAELNNARAELDRKRQLVESGLLSRIELDSLETRYRVAQSQLELARAQRRQSEAEQRELTIRQSQTKVYSPINGIIAKRHVDIGAMASASTPVVTVVSLSPMVIEAKASERDIARIKRGAQVAVTVDSLPGQKFTGRVMRISPLLDPQTRNGLIEIEIPNRNGVLKGEMFARLDLDLGSERETALLPRDALVYRGDQPGVYIIESDTAKFRTVETGLTQEDKVEVVNGLKVGDVVITRGSNLLKDGDRVRVMDRQQGGQGSGRGGRQQESAASSQQPNQPSQQQQPPQQGDRGRRNTQE